MPATATLALLSRKLATPAISGARTWVTLRTASAPSAPLPRASTSPASSMTTARAGSSERSRPRLSIGVPLHLAPLERERRRVRRPQQFSVHAREKTPEPPLVWHAEHDHPRPLLRCKPPVVEIVAIDRDQDAPELTGQPALPAVARAATVRMR